MLVTHRDAGYRFIHPIGRPGTRQQSNRRRLGRAALAIDSSSAGSGGFHGSQGFTLRCRRKALAPALRCLAIRRLTGHPIASFRLVERRCQRLGQSRLSADCAVSGRESNP